MSKTLKDLIVDKILQSKLKEEVNTNSICPSYIEVAREAEKGLTSVLNVSSIPSEEYMGNISASSVNTNLATVKEWIKLAAKSLTPIVAEYEQLTFNYESIARRIFNETDIFRDKIYRLLNPSCIYINSKVSNQTDSSNCGKIGSFITLPFFITSAKMYNGGAFIRASASGEVVFSNTGRIKSIPLNEWIAMKVTGGRNETFSFTISLEKEVQANAIYIRMLNKVQNTRLTLYNKDNIVFDKKYNSNELFSNFKPVTFDTVTIFCEYVNTNSDKPYAVQLDKIEIFEKIQFSKEGFFESKEATLDDTSGINNIGISYIDQGDISATRTRDLLSLSSKSNTHEYNILDKNDNIDLTVHKFRWSKTWNQYDIDATTSVGVPTPNGDIRNFYRFPIDKQIEPAFWEMDYRSALIFHGLPKAYCTTTNIVSPAGDLIYENWTKVDNYWKTMMMIYEDNVMIDIGEKTCFINSKLSTGKIYLPKGIIEISVHERDIDFKYGKTVANNLDVTDQVTVYGDPLFPYNFAYLFSGLPDYTSDGSLGTEVDRKYDVSDTGISTVILGESFLPLTLSVKDSNNQLYELTLSGGAAQPGTFSIEPYTGKIKVHPLTGAYAITVKYRRASPFRRAVGIPFKRLLTFMPIKRLMGLKWNDDSFFTLDGGPTNRALLIQDNGERVVHSHILFNRIQDNIYTSIKIDMESSDRYLTPIIDKIYISLE